MANQKMIDWVKKCIKAAEVERDNDLARGDEIGADFWQTHIKFCKEELAELESECAGY